MEEWGKGGQSFQSSIRAGSLLSIFHSSNLIPNAGREAKDGC